MGMFDYIDDITAYCPQCGRRLTDAFQTKDFGESIRFLEHYKPGDTLPEDRDAVAFIQVYNICTHCKLFTNIYLVVQNNVLMHEFW
jgi:hypothetical protein